MSYPVLSDAEQEIVEQGEAARFLLDDPRFLRAIEAVRAQCAEAILSSNPAAREAREDAYNLSRGLSAITVELSHVASQAEQVLAAAEAQAVDDDEAQPDVTPVDY